MKSMPACRINNLRARFVHVEPFVPAKAGIQGPLAHPFLGPRFRGDERLVALRFNMTEICARSSLPGFDPAIHPLGLTRFLVGCASQPRAWRVGLMHAALSPPECRRP